MTDTIPAVDQDRRRWRSNYPAPDDRRCDALAKWDGQRRMSHRCKKYGIWFRDGRFVCIHHFESETVNYAEGCGDRVGTYRATMALALGDVERAKDAEPY